MDSRIRRQPGLTRRTALAAAWSLGGAALAQTPDPPADPQEPVDPQVLGLTPNLMTRLMVEVVVSGEGPFLFVLDTGAGRTVLSQELAEALHLPAGPPVIVHGIVSAEAAPTVIVPTLRFADSFLRDLETPVFPRNRLFADGLLGVDVLGAYRIVFDAARRRIELSRSDRRYLAKMDRDGSLIRRGNLLRGRRRFGGLTVVRVEADDVPVSAFVDSGAQYSIGNIALLEAIETRRPDLRTQAIRTPIFGVIGQQLTGDLAFVPRLRIGSTVLQDTPVVFADVHAFRVWDLMDEPALVLGADLISRFRQVTVDFGRSELTFGRPLIRPN